MSTELVHVPNSDAENPTLDAILAGLFAAGKSCHRAYRWTVELADVDARKHISQLPRMALCSLGPRTRKIKPLPDDGHRPLIFVHGLGGHPGNHLALRSYLGLKGRRRIYSVNLGKGTPLLEAADAVSTAIERIVAANGLGLDAQVDLMAHSMGGLVCRLAIENETVRARVATIVTMGSPHQGTLMARLVGPSAARAQELRIDSSTVHTLNAQLPWPKTFPRLVSLWSPNDVLVMPTGQAEVEGAINHRCDGFTHFTWLLEPHGWRVVEAALAELTSSPS
ncbi:MAG: triacylglycerol esterase/lipase EstA (alpha/beta hydrolase family) [Bradymonadia bacterium]|jgi:triacylglycerol esterase/lipase EstA (alpha/beta hydrolase family)